MDPVTQSLIDNKFVILFHHQDPDTCRKVIDAALEGGGSVIEFTNRGPGAIDIFHMLVNEYRGAPFVLGAGTICDREQAECFIDAGAQFVVSPFLDDEMVEYVVSRQMPVYPGCGTVTEIHRAVKLGAELIKVFPAPAAGGPGFIKAVLAPLPHVKLMPTGGVTAEEENLKQWMDAGSAAVGLGSQLVRKEWIEQGDYASITGAVKGVVKVLEQY